ncbi:unnamed protein product [Symbiodinium natans]|uniref:Uncharacterized protein n=1 Tax=Symbiodinium natans TaxID=878477 RepID=A0A812RVI3_9DINO|nr:unnamed protein product [Symbiodinium natans]
MSARPRERRPLKSVRNVRFRDFAALTGPLAGCKEVARYPPFADVDFMWQVLLAESGSFQPVQDKDETVCSLSSAGHVVVCAAAEVHHLTDFGVQVSSNAKPFTSFSVREQGELPPHLAGLALWVRTTPPQASHCVRPCRLSAEEVVETGPCSLVVVLSLCGLPTAYFPRWQQQGGKLCLCPDCRADGGGDGFKIPPGEAIVMQPGESISVVAVGGPAVVVLIELQLQNARL